MSGDSPKLLLFSREPTTLGRHRRAWPDGGSARWPRPVHGGADTATGHLHWVVGRSAYLFATTTGAGQCFGYLTIGPKYLTWNRGGSTKGHVQRGIADVERIENFESVYSGDLRETGRWWGCLNSVYELPARTGAYEYLLYGNVVNIKLITPVSSSTPTTTFRKQIARTL